MKSHIEQSADVWVPNYPRNCAGPVGANWRQVKVNGQQELLHNLNQIQGKHPGYVSTYSFPDGHPTDNPDNIPLIDTLMIDFDFDFNQDQFDHQEWKQKLNDLLTRLRMVAKALIETGYAKYWRASLSGYKGVHLYLDFPPIEDNLGEPVQYRNGMSSFTDSVVENVKAETAIGDLEKYVDVTSGWDFSRLTRLPNTVHEKATKQFGEKRYCVPVSIKELSKVNVNTYSALTKSSREIPKKCQRIPNQRTKNIAEQFIITSPKTVSEDVSASVKSEVRFEEYKNKVVNENVELDDVEFLLSRKPCIWAFHENPEKFIHGNASHIMEMQCILAMASIGTPLEVMHKFFKYHPEEQTDPRYSEEETEKRLREVLSREYGEFNCSTILQDAPEFCLKQGCKIYQDDKSLQRIH